MPIFNTKEMYLIFLREKYIPKLRAMGFIFTADQFEEAIYWLHGEQETDESEA
jgi:hypothetical protein